MSEALDSSAAQIKRKQAKKHRAKVASLKSAKPRSRAQGYAPRSGWKGVGVGVVLLALCVGLGVQISSQSQRMRALYSELQKDQTTQDTLLAQRSRLLIERGALNSYNGAEKLASEKLGMRFPEVISRVVAPNDSVRPDQRKTR